jgi:hypothetical protein
MAKKAFEIQGSDLSLGGVNLQAGTNGVVIPGITQATNYFVEEVDDTSVDQTTTIENTPLVIDAVSYNVLLGDANASIATYSSYTVELEDDFYIDEITVASRGTYTEQEKTMNETTDMWAYGGAVSADAFTPFVSTDWFQVPFRPKMRADEVTTIGGGGSGSRVKLESPGDRRIEEVYGYKEVSVTEVTYGPVIENVVALGNTGMEWQFFMPSTPELLDIMNGVILYGFQISSDQITWYPAYIGGYDGVTYLQIVLHNNAQLAFSPGQTVYYQTTTGADPVVWWDSDELPGGGQNFRGATINYHAYTGESTIIGTIHIVKDSGEEHISHTEVQSGSTDGENDDLWLVTQEGQIKYRRLDKEAKTLKVQWSARVFYGSEFWD